MTAPGQAESRRSLTEPGATGPVSGSCGPGSGERPFTVLLEKLARRQDLAREEAAQALELVAEGVVGENEIAAFLIALRTKGETAEEIAGLVEAMRRKAVAVPVKGGATLVDVVGTGGDGLGTFNISTTAALVVAGAGVKVAKHGNRGASSRCGSADVLEALGVDLTLEPEEIAECIERVGMGFMLAPRHHPAAGRVAGVRRSLGVRTVFNFLGPLTNPAGAQRFLLGVSVPQYLPVIAEALARLGCERALVVSGDGGMDELAVTGPSTLIEVREGQTGAAFTVEPYDYGLPRHPLSALVGGDAGQNAAITRAVLEGAGGAPRDAVLLNAGAALYVAGVCESIKAGVEKAGEVLDSGRALEVLERLVAFTQSCSRGRSVAADTRRPGAGGLQQAAGGVQQAAGGPLRSTLDGLHGAGVVQEAGD